MGLDEFLGKWGVLLCAIADGVLIGFGIIFGVLGFYYHDKIGGSEGPTDAFMYVSILLVALGITGSIALWMHNWFMLLICNGCTVAMLVALFAFTVVAFILGYDIKDPVKEGIDEEWVNIRAEMETEGLCNDEGACPAFYSYVDQVKGASAWQDASPETKAKCDPLTKADFGKDCKLATDCKYDMGQNKVKGCKKCDESCKTLAITQGRDAMVPLAYTCYMSFFFLLCVAGYNDWLGEREAWGGAEGDLFDGVKDPAEWRGIALNGFNAFMAFVLVILGALKADTSNAALGICLLGLCLMGACGTVAVGIFMQNPLTPLLMFAGNCACVGLAFALLLVGVVAGLSSGTVTDLQDRIDEDWDEIRTEIQTVDPHYCAYMDDDQCKKKIKDYVEDESRQMVYISIFVIAFLFGKSWLMHRTTKFMYKFDKLSHAVM
jgi:hypothetical protein